MVRWYDDGEGDGDGEGDWADGVWSIGGGDHDDDDDEAGDVFLEIACCECESARTARRLATSCHAEKHTVTSCCSVLCYRRLMSYADGSCLRRKGWEGEQDGGWAVGGGGLIGGCGIAAAAAVVVLVV